MTSRYANRPGTSRTPKHVGGSASIHNGKEVNMVHVTEFPDNAVVVEVATVSQYVALEKRIDGAESDGIEARWDFGQRLLDERAANGGKQLPHGRLDEIVEATGKSRREIQFRIQFAEQYPTPEKVRNALHTFGSWYGIVSDGFDGRAEKPHVAHNTGDNEWYTPAEYIQAAVDVMGGIDCDPASSVAANKQIGASTFYTAADNGLVQEWHGRVWLNPPYDGTLIAKFSKKLVDEYVSDRTSEAIVLVNNATETDWFLRLASVGNAFCFPTSRVKFWAPDGRIAAPLQGQAIVYFGANQQRFVERFAAFGLCLVKP